MVPTRNLAQAMQHLRGKPEFTDWELGSADIMERYLTILTFIQKNGRVGFRIVAMTAQGSQIVGVRCERCSGPVREGDSWCGTCRKLSFNPVQEGGPPFGLMNPTSAYPIPDTALQGGIRGIASYLAAEEEVERITKGHTVDG
jgi:hypothetical protein